MTCLRIDPTSEWLIVTEDQLSQGYLVRHPDGRSERALFDVVKSLGGGEYLVEVPVRLGDSP